MAYDSTTGTVVLFGGYNVELTYLNDTWTWDRVTWTEQFRSYLHRHAPGDIWDIGKVV